MHSRLKTVFKCALVSFSFLATLFVVDVSGNKQNNKSNGAINLIPNSGFDDFKNDVPSGWTFKSWNREFSRERVFRSAPGCNNLGNCLELVFDNTLVSSTLSSNPIKIKENQYYIFKGNYASTFGNINKIAVTGYWLNDKGEKIDSFTFSLPDTQNLWCPFFDEAKSPLGSKEITIEIIMKWDEGHIKFDDFSLREGMLKDYQEEFYPAVRKNGFFPIYGWIAPTKSNEFYNESKYPKNANFFNSDRINAEYAAANFTVGDNAIFGTKKLLRWTEADNILKNAIDDDSIWGLMGKDEPVENYFSTLVEQKRRLSDFSNKIIFNNLLPMYGFKEKPFEEYINYVRKYIKQVKPNFVTFDHYSLLGQNQKYEPSWFTNLEIMRNISKEANIHFGVFCGSSAVCGVRSPNEAELRWQAFTSLAYGSRFLGWFTYLRQIQSEGLRDTIIDEYGNRTSHYASVRQINSEILAIAPTLIQLESTGVYHSKLSRDQVVPSTNLPPNKPISESYLLSEVKDGEVVLGEFENSQDKHYYFMLVNRDFTKSSKPRLVFKKKINKLYEISRSDGNMMPVDGFKSGSNEAFLHLAAGDGRLFCIDFGSSK